MKISKTSTTAHITNFRRNARAIPYALEQTYTHLVGLLEPYQEHFEVKANTEAHFELWTNHVFRSNGLNAKYKKGLMFAAVVVYKKFVSLYFYPLYMSKPLKENLSDELKPFLTGESCFHFKTLEEIPLSELHKLIDDGFAFYKEQGWVNA